MKHKKAPKDRHHEQVNVLFGGGKKVPLEFKIRLK